MHLQNLNIILIKTRFPENIGMVARACANMGCPSLALVSPERWDPLKALPLATPKGETLLNNLTIYNSLSTALADSHKVFATSARTGGWRRNILNPQKAALKIACAIKKSLKVSIVFGPEDKGLLNEELIFCPNLVHIPTYGANSLNLAQAVLIILYECSKAVDHSGNFEKTGKYATRAEISHLERELLGILKKLDCLHGKNPDYYFLQWQHLLARIDIKKHEYSALMGFLRQLNNFIDNGGCNGKNEAQ